MCINLWYVYSDVWLILKNLNTLTAIYDALMGIQDSLEMSSYFLVPSLT